MMAATTGSVKRFVNETNPTSKYEWHQKSDMGVLSVTINGKIHSLNCEKKQSFRHRHMANILKKTCPNRQLNLPIKHLN
ncbi:hypothetical protein ACSF86_07425 [Moraxella bovoculi]|uniref:hypothetical protein n=1 Tax=Moraxella bovoculi TaxID=386891 RepID=UPI003F503F96